MKRTADSVREGIVADNAAGLPPRTIAAKWGVHPSTVSRLVGTKRKMTMQQAASILSAYRRGVSSAVIASEIGVSVTTINRVLNGKTGVARKAAGGIND